MAVAYAAVVSLVHTIDQIQYHPRPPISLDRKQVESLAEKIAFLQELLEACNFRGGSEEADLLLVRIRDAAYAAEDIIESHIVDQILARSTSTNDGEKISCVDLYRGLQKVIQDMDLIKKEVMEIKEYKMAIQDDGRKISPAAVSVRYPPTSRDTIVVFGDVLFHLKDQLFRWKCDLRIITIFGMMGIGKTALARNVYEDSFGVRFFDIRAWVTISLEYNAKDILVKVLCQSQGNRKSLSEKSVQELGVILNKSLSDKSYLIILDNMWSIEMWDEVKSYFPDNHNGSTIIMTTRQYDLASYLVSTYAIQMNLLNRENSWDLLCEIVFRNGYCPPKLERIGRRIVEKCHGLPLSILAVGGLLAKSNLACQDWAYVEENLTFVSEGAEEHCLKILHTSYNFLPVHLKLCFLYMGIFPEVNEIRVSQLIKLWVAEGILRPISGKTLEVVAEEYLKDLIDRNLVLVQKWGSSCGKIKSCSINHILRDLCIREAYKDMFYARAENNLVLPNGINTERRIAILGVGNFGKVCHALQCASPTRSLICDVHEVLPSLGFRLLRVLKAVDRCSYDGEESHNYNLDAFFQLLNLRHLDISNGWNRISSVLFPSSVHLMWNLQTLIVKDLKEKVEAPPDFWKMPQLRHVEFNELYLPDPSSDHHMDERDSFVLGNLQTLLKVVNFKFGEEVVKRIPNVKKLQLSYEEWGEGFDVASYYCLNNLGHLQKLESLACSFFDEPCRSDLLQNLTFPHSLKKLTLYGTELYWKDMSTMIGSLPLLEVLRLKHRSFIGREWEPVEGQFCSLRFLIINYCDSLRRWVTDSCHFPCLERLVFRYLYKLKEIPSGIGEIPTLQLIQLDFCSDSAVISAKRILEEQEEFGNYGLQVKVLLLEENRELQSLACPNFQVSVV